MSFDSFVLAHGSGIDDIAWFVVPAVLALWLLRVAERRARRRAAEQGESPAEQPDRPTGGEAGK